MVHMDVVKVQLLKKYVKILILNLYGLIYLILKGLFLI